LIVFNKELPCQVGRAAAVVALAVILTVVIASLGLRLADQFGRLPFRHSTTTSYISLPLPNG
jgi:hypothetical protein